MKPGTPSLQSNRLLDQVRELVRYKHYSLKTEKNYLYWILFLFAGMRCSTVVCVTPPREMGVADVEEFLSRLTNERKASSITHNQALSALLFLPRGAEH